MKFKCKNCLDVIESTSRHDFQACSCYIKSQTIIDNYKGKRYDVQNMFYTKEFFDFIDENATGFWIDGGNQYCRMGGTLEDIEEIEDGD